MASTWRNCLSNEQADALDTLRMKTPCPTVFRNCTVILMSDAGRSKPSIAEALGCGTATLNRVRCRLRAGPSTVRRVLAHERFSLQRPKHALEGKREEKAHAKAKKERYRLEKKALRENAAEALVFQDETEIHTHPVLTRMWARIGRQPRIFSPGQNQKKVVYGAVDYATGKITTTIDDLVTAFRRCVQAVNAKRNKMGFMFDHDDVTGKIAA